MRKYLTAFILLANIFVTVFLVQATVLAYIGQFKILYLYVALVIALILTSFFIRHIYRDIQVVPRVSVAFSIVCCFVFALLIFFPHDTFGGRDEAIYLNGAVRLATTGSLELPSYLNGLADNYIENLRIQPFGYIVWIATQNIFFGQQGALRGNVIIIVLGLFSFYLVASLLGGRKTGLIALVLYVSSMPFLWFSRETMSENLAFYLLWGLIIFFFIYLRTKHLRYLLISFACSWLFALTRIEGFYIQLMFLVLLPIILVIKKVADYKRIALIVGVYLLFVFSNIYVARATYAPFIRETFRSVQYGIKRSVQPLASINLAKRDVGSLAIIQNKYNKLYDNIPLFFSMLLAKYNFFIVIFSLVFIFFYTISRKRYTSVPSLCILIILVLLIPEYFKFISPGVTIDEPWLYRRYMYALLPFGYVCLVLLLKSFRQKKIVSYTVIVLLIINIVLSKDIVFLKNNWLLGEKISEIGKDVMTDDLLIIESWTLGYYYPASYYIQQKEIRTVFASFFIINGLSPETKKYKNVPYNRIFVLTTKKRLNFPQFTIQQFRSVDVNYNQLIPSCQLYMLGATEGLSNPYNIGILPIDDAMRYCSKLGFIIENHKETLYLYELVYEGT